ncbi:MAG: FAD/NAD(P)-binding protein [Mycobacteriaceae bacterium]|nr:FAD/NAD(P)-binding protein [Mycobacteriaceae bacterium]
MHRFDVAIIGGGASGVAALAALAQQQERLGAQPISVAVIESDSRRGHGRVYGADSHWLLMNSPAHLLSIRSDDSNHFIHWLQRRGNAGTQTGPYSYVSRVTYGEYLRAQFQWLTTKSRYLNIYPINAWTERLDLNIDDGVRICLNNASALIARKVVLATGPSTPNDPYALTGHPGYLAHPYPVTLRLADVPPEHDVAVIGSSLTAIDVALSLAHLGHRGKITLASRHGLLPEVRPDYTMLPHGDTPSTPWQHKLSAPADALQAFREFFATTIDAQKPYAGFGKIMSKNPVENLYEAVQNSDNPASAGFTYRCLRFNELDQVYMAMQQVWPCLNETEIMAFMGNHYSTWQRLLTPIPLINAQKVLALIKAGALRVRGGLHSVLPTRDESFQLFFAGNTQDTARIVINATGSRRNLVSPGESHLFAHLKQGGHLRELPTGGARVTHPAGNLIGLAGPVAHVHAVGHPSIGSHPCINDLILIAANAALLAQAICTELHRQRLSSTAREWSAW